MRTSSLYRMAALTLLLTLALSLGAAAQTKIVHWSFPLLENEMERLWQPFIEKFTRSTLILRSRWKSCPGPPG